MAEGTTYNGWTNRETWAANLWITNDMSLYAMAREQVDATTSTRQNGQELKTWWESLTDPDEEIMSCKDILKMVRDIGQEDAINWEEIATGLLE